MKKLLNVVVLALLTTSCSSYSFIQVGKLYSDNVQMNDKGKFEYKLSDLIISYDFWNNGGNVSFMITNTSDKDIYLLMDKCYFVQNGTAYDYYKNRTYVIAEKDYDVLLSNSGRSIEMPEIKTVCIPAHSAKHFSEFKISNIPYRQCGFARDAKSEDGEKIVFKSAKESPQSFENRLVFNINGEIVPVVNKFYVGEYLNMYNENGYAYISTYGVDCKGNVRYDREIRSYKHASSCCFYITYECYSSEDNDRIYGAMDKDSALQTTTPNNVEKNNQLKK